MKWTREKPLVPGIYWHRYDADDIPEIVEVAFDAPATWHFWVIAEEADIGAENFSGEWQGPIHPEE